MVVDLPERQANAPRAGDQQRLGEPDKALAAGVTLHRQRFLNAAETDPRLARVLAGS